MISIQRAEADYGVTVVPATEEGAFRVVGFILSHEHMPAILLFKIQEPGGQGVRGLHVRVTNGGTGTTFGSNRAGYCDMAIGGGSYYDPGAGQSGPHTAEIVEGPSDRVSGLGMWDDHQSLITVWERTGGGGGDDMGDIEYDLPEGFSMHTHFRFARVEPRPGPGFHVTKLTAVGVTRKRDDKVLTVTFRKADGSPAEGVRVRVKTHGTDDVVHVADEDGEIFLAMGEDWWYAVPGEPAKAILPVAAGELIGDTVVVGVVQGRWDWLNIRYQWSGDEEPPGPPGLPTFDNLEVGANDFSVWVQCAGAVSVGYTLDGPEYHRSGSGPLGEAGIVLMSDTLNPATDYELKAWGTNEQGDGPDAFLEFTTMDEGEPPEPPPVPEDWRELFEFTVGKLQELIDAIQVRLDDQE